MSRILVTGASGFLGSAVVRRLQNEGRTVRATGRNDSQPDFDDYRPMDLTHPKKLADLLADVSSIIHCAGLAHQFQAHPEQESQFHRINCEATKKLACAAADQGIERFVFVSSVSVYGPAKGSGPRNEDETPMPVGPYATSKRQAERELLRIATETKLQVAILRMSTLYGEGDPGNFGRLIDAIQRGRFVMIGSGRNRKSLIHREDAASACVQAAVAPTDRPVGIWNIAGEPRTMKDIVAGIANSWGQKPPRWNIPATAVSGLLGTIAALGIGPVRPWAKTRNATVQKWLADDAYDGSRFAKDFQWLPRITLEEGLHQLAKGHQSLKDHSVPHARAA